MRRSFTSSSGGAPAAELILLPDGGELKQDHITPILKSFDRIRHARHKIDDLMRKCEDKRSTLASRAAYRKEIEAADQLIAGLLRDMPLRPSLVEDITNRLHEKIAEFDKVENLPRPARTAARQALEERTGMPRRAMHAYYTRSDKPQQLYQKKYLDPDLQARLSPQLRKLLALDDPENDEISSRITGLSGFLK